MKSFTNSNESWGDKVTASQEPVAMDDQTLRERFSSLVLRFHPGPTTVFLWSQTLISRYTESQRHYHTTSHIAAMLLCLSHHESVDDRLAVELAIFFHDWIYDPASKTNELDSIAEFERFAGQVLIDGAVRRRVVSMIEATIKHQMPEKTSAEDSSDMELFLDFDLKVLGLDWNEYELYAKQIRKEYRCYDDAAYCSGRVKVLRQFLGREKIYFSETYYKQNEETARQNILREIALLETGGVLE